MEEITYTSREIIDINKDSTPNYAVWKYVADMRTRVIISIERLK